MILGIKTKIFLTLFLVSTIVVLGMYGFMQWSFQRGFLNYVNAQDLNNMGRLADNLIAYYRQEGSWQALGDKSGLWQEIQRKSGPKMPGPEAPPAPRGARGAANDPLRIGPRMALVAADGKTLVVGGGGRSESVAQMSLRPLEVDGRIVGYLGLSKPSGLSSSVDLLYVEQQSRIFAVIALAMILISLVLGLPLLNHLLVPVKAMTKGAGKLAAGDYGTRIPELSRDELGRLTQVFNLLAATLGKNEVSRRNWMADISHELRTPLAVLSGEIEALRDGVRKADEPTLAALYGEIQRINRLVGDLHELSMSDLGALSYRKHPIDPVVAVEQALELFTPRMAAAGLELKAWLPAEETLVFNADSHRFQQLLTNLLENSMRYTDPGGRVELRLQECGRELQLIVEDSAPGVDAEQLPRLFERLYRVESSRSRAKGGTGLGLAICRNIVEAHQGRIEALASTLGGVRVEIYLPLG